MISGRFGAQARACYQLGSPLYGALLEQAAADIQKKGPCWELLAAYPYATLGTDEVLPLRVMAAVHRLVLDGRAPELAHRFPSAGGDTRGDVWRPFVHVVADHRELLSELMARPVQTNEVGRSAALLGGFLLAARETGLPLRPLEIGASAGLNLLWDRYGYARGDVTWGDLSSPVKFDDVFVSGCPPFEVRAEVAERRGCDTAPLDPRSEEDRLALTSYVWADDTRRIELLWRALDVAQHAPAPVDRADGPEWLAAQLERPVAGVVTVIFHSLIMPYVGVKTAREMRAGIERAGVRASTSAPLALLQMERGRDDVEVHLTMWPAGVRRLIARTNILGRQIRWLGS